MSVLFVNNSLCPQFYSIIHTVRFYIPFIEKSIISIIFELINLFSVSRLHQPKKNLEANTLVQKRKSSPPPPQKKTNSSDCILCTVLIACIKISIPDTVNTELLNCIETSKISPYSVFQFNDNFPQFLLGALEITANLCCNCLYLCWEGCVICSVYLRYLLGHPVRAYIHTVYP